MNFATWKGSRTGKGYKEHWEEGLRPFEIRKLGRGGREKREKMRANTGGGGNPFYVQEPEEIISYQGNEHGDVQTKASEKRGLGADKKGGIYAFQGGAP